MSRRSIMNWWSGVRSGVALERAERLSTIAMAFLGFVAFFLQLQERASSRAEILVIETGEPSLTTAEAVQLPISVINRSDREIYIRDVQIYHGNRLLNISVEPNSVVEVKPGAMVSYSMSPISPLTAFQFSQASNLRFQITTTRGSVESPARFAFSQRSLNAIAVAAGRQPPTLVFDSVTASELRKRVDQECGALGEGYAIGKWRDPSTNTTVMVEDLMPGQEYLIGCTQPAS